MTKAKYTSPDTKPKIEIFDPISEINKKFGFYINVVIAVLVIGLMTLLIMTATLIIDSFHINSATYKEFSGKLEIQNVLLETNKQNQELIKQYQEIIINLQKQPQNK